MHTKYAEQGSRGLGLGNAGIVRHFKRASKERNGGVYVTNECWIFKKANDSETVTLTIRYVTSSDVYNVALRYVTIISVSVCVWVCLPLSPRCSRFLLLITWEGGLAPRWTLHPLKDTLLRKTRERERTRPKECVRH